MSATMDAAPVAGYLDGCPVIDVPAGRIPSTIAYTPRHAVAGGVGRARANGRPGAVLSARRGGDPPGGSEVAADRRRRFSRGRRAARSPVGRRTGRALRPSARRRVILATNIAETSLTVPGVRRSSTPGCTRSRATIRIARSTASRPSASRRLRRPARRPRRPPWPPERSGGCGTRPTTAARTASPRSTASISPAVVLDVLAWGGDPRTLDGSIRPPATRSTPRWSCCAARRGERHALTALGARMQRLPIHPRLARILIAAGGAGEAALACALLSERHFAAPPATHVERSADVVDEPSAICRRTSLASPGSSASLVVGRPSSLDERRFRRALFAGYPDRVRAPRAGLAAGAAGVGPRRRIGPESGVRDGEYSSRSTSRPSPTAERLGGPHPDGERRRTGVAAANRRAGRACVRRGAGTVRADERDYYGASCSPSGTSRQPEDAAARCSPTSLCIAACGADEAVAAPPALRRARARRRRPRAAAAHGKRSLADSLADALTWSSGRSSTAPRRRAAVPSGRSLRSTITKTDRSSATVKLQELFGLARHAAHRPAREPVLLVLLAPNGRPVQTDARPAQLLGTHVPGGAQGAARTVPEAPLAGRSVDGAVRRAEQAAGCRRLQSGQGLREALSIATTVAMRSSRARVWPRASAARSDPAAPREAARASSGCRAAGLQRLAQLRVRDPSEIPVQPAHVLDRMPAATSAVRCPA